MGQYRKLYHLFHYVTSYYYGLSWLSATILKMDRYIETSSYTMNMSYFKLSKLESWCMFNIPAIQRIYHAYVHGLWFTICMSQDCASIILLPTMFAHASGMHVNLHVHNFHMYNCMYMHDNRVQWVGGVNVSTMYKANIILPLLYSWNDYFNCICY